jgi:outer membrane protein assembly factor BamB
MILASCQPSIENPEDFSDEQAPRSITSFKWKFKGKGDISHKPCTDGNMIYVVNKFGGLSALNIETGEPIWNFPSKKFGMRSSPLMYNDLVIVGNGDSRIHALNASTGKSEWSFKTVEEPMEEMIRVEDTLYCAARSGYVYKINLKTAQEIWSFKGSKGRYPKGLQLTGAYIGFHMDGGGLHMIERKTGKLAFSQKHRWSNTPSFFGNVALATDGLRVFALDMTTGERLWTYDLEGIISTGDKINLEGNSVYVGCQDDFVYKIDAKSGVLAWKQKLPSAPDSEMSLVGDVLFSGCDDKHLYALDDLTGKILWKYKTDGDVRSSPLVYDGTVYFGSIDDCLYAIE